VAVLASTRSRVIAASVTAIAVMVAAIGIGLVVGRSFKFDPSGCASAEVIFARGTGEAPGLGSVGTSFVADLKGDLSSTSMSVYAVKYAAEDDQRSVKPGSLDLISHIKAEAVRCPNQRFVLGGYSQGASVVDDALGLFFSSPLPPALAPKIAAVVVFGNPLGLTRLSLETASATYGSISKSFCNDGDIVCGRGLSTAAHDAYVTNGSTRAGAQFAALRLR
jgi:cutinase